jgi:hypothetical protein
MFEHAFFEFHATIHATEIKKRPSEEGTISLTADLRTDYSTNKKRLLPKQQSKPGS